MRKLVLTLGIAALASAFPTVGYGQAKMAATATPAAPATATPAAKKPDAPAPASARPLPFQGKVDKVNKAARTFTFKTKEGKEVLFHVTDKTKIMANDAPAAIDDLKHDEIVRGSRIKLGENDWEAVKVIIGAKTDKAVPAEVAAKPAPAKRVP